MTNHDLTTLVAIVHYLGHYVHNRLDVLTLRKSHVFRTNFPQSMSTTTLQDLMVRQEHYTSSPIQEDKHNAEVILTYAMSLNYSLLAEQRIVQSLNLGNVELEDTSCWIAPRLSVYTSKLIINNCHTNLELHTFSFKNLIRTSKLISFGSYNDHNNFHLLSMIYKDQDGNGTLRMLKGFLCSANHVVISDELDMNHLILGNFISIFICEVSRNLSTILTLPMIFELYSYFCNHPEHPKMAGLNSQTQKLHYVFQNYFPMVIKHAVAVSTELTIGMNDIISKVLGEDRGDTHTYVYSLDTREWVSNNIAKLDYLNKMQSLITDWLSLTQNIRIMTPFDGGDSVISKFMHRCKLLLYSWYNIQISDEEGITIQDDEFNTIIDTFANLCGDIIYADL